MSWWKKSLLAISILIVLAGTPVFVYFYTHFARMIDARLSGDVFNNSSLILAAPEQITIGETESPQECAARLRKALYSEGEGGSQVGYYKLSPDRLDVYPGDASFFHGDVIREGPAELEFRDGHVAAIIDLSRNVRLQNYWLEPQVITTIFGDQREKRRLVRYQDLPQVLVNAILAAEDHRFLSHHGVDFLRVLGAAIADVRADQRLQGGSTLTMQLARNFFLTQKRTFKRKAQEVFIAGLLEQRLTKEQIFEMYANQIYLGQRGSFAIYGVGEASNAYFNKDVSSLTLPEAALLAGIIRGPSLYDPYRNRDRATNRRNWVLKEMAEDGYVTPAQAEEATKVPLGLAQRNTEASQAPYFVDMVRDELADHFTDRELLSQSYRIYTTLDLDLQRAATEGARVGLEEVDKTIESRHRRRGSPPRDPNQPQFAMVVLDPHNGQIRALIGGRNYTASQLNHALARRQPGSSFKPFVYAAALNSAVDGSQPLITPATVLMDEPTTFVFGDQTYEPENFEHEYYGPVSVREALMHSLNVATVRLAEMVGYDKVRELAIQAGINSDLRATPAIALGAYVATPLEMAGAYTVFANDGVYEAPRMILAVNDSSGRALWNSPTVSRQVLDPRIDYLMVSLMQSVINNGTGYGARSRGFTLPAAGKTGTSSGERDGWFAGFTSNLLTVVWVGYDDDRQLNLEGAASALPIWTEVMKRTTSLAAYENVLPFIAPPGIVTEPIDTRTNLVASAESLDTRDEVFVEGTAPVFGSPTAIPGIPDSEMVRPAGASGVLTRIFHPDKNQKPTSAVPLPAGAPPPGNPAAVVLPPQPPQQKLDDKPKGGVLRKFLSIFKGKSSKPKDEPQPENPKPEPEKNP
ncbi:MAG: penicillin-binding protein 1A [Deltaproteobacteria bacterium]